MAGWVTEHPVILKTQKPPSPPQARTGGQSALGGL